MRRRQFSRSQDALAYCVIRDAPQVRTLLEVDRRQLRAEPKRAIIDKWLLDSKGTDWWRGVGENESGECGAPEQLDGREQASKRASEQASKRAGEQASRRTSEQANKRARYWRPREWKTFDLSPVAEPRFFPCIREELTSWLRLRKVREFRAADAVAGWCPAVVVGFELRSAIPLSSFASRGLLRSLTPSPNKSNSAFR
jgi:hypothetical protein